MGVEFEEAVDKEEEGGDQPGRASARKRSGQGKGDDSVDLRSWSFWDGDAHEDLSSLSEVGSLGDKLEPPKVDVRARDDGDESLA